MVYVLNIKGNPLMPCKEAKARKLLKTNKAKIYKREPFTIQLLFECENAIQDIALGVDAGSKHVGLSATTQKKELYSAVVELRNDIVEKLSTRRELRQTRRNRKTRYRKARFLNRVKSKHKGWLAPSVENKIQTHIRVVSDIHKVLPITKIIIETASFDIQKITNPDIDNLDYQQGEQKDFWNVREYVLFRDGHTCQHCKGKFKDNILNVHHLESRKTGGNAPDNLITLCETCHKKYHKGEIQLKQRKHHSFRDAAFMGIMRWSFYDKLKELYPNVNMTYGYITKNTRIINNLPKEHYIDARCISGNPLAEPLGYYFYQRKVRCHNRQLHKMTILKGGIRQNNQAPYIVKGFRLFDKVKYLNKEYFIFARRASGRFDIRDLKGTKVNSGGTNSKYIQLINVRRTLLSERRVQCFS